MANNPYSGGTPTVPAEVDQPVDPLQRINVNPDTFGAQVGRGLSVVGGSLSDLSQVWGSVQADAATNNAMTQLGNTVDQFKSLNGQAALNAQQATLKSIQQIFENNRRSLSPQAALEFDRATERYRWDANSVVSTHADQQGKVYADQVNKSSLDIAMTGIANTAVDDPMMAMWWRERARTAAVKSLELAGNGSNPVLRQNAIDKADQASAEAYIGAIEAKDPVLALKVANEPYFKKDLGVKYNEVIQRLQAKGDQASGRGAGATAIAKAQNDANAAAVQPQAPGSSDADRAYYGSIPKAADVYSKIPPKGEQGEDQLSRFRQWNPDPVGNSSAILNTVHPDLQAIVRLAQKENPDLPFVVALGKTTPAQSAQAAQWGWAQGVGEGTAQHERGNVVDLWPLDNGGHVVFDRTQQDKINGAMQKAAGELGLNLRWGGLQGEGGANKNFRDAPNFQLLNPRDVAQQPKAQPVSYNQGAPQLPPPAKGIPAGQYGQLMTSAAMQNGIDPNLFTRQIYRESGFRTDAVSPAGARGIAQFIPGTAAKYGVDVHDPASSINGAARYMRDLKGMFGGNDGLALAGYNWGEGNVQKWLQSGADPARMPKETRDYVEGISGHPIDAWLKSSFQTPPEPLSGGTVPTGRVTFGEPEPSLPVPSASDVLTPASATSQEPPLPGAQGQPEAPAVAPTQVDPNSTQAMMAAAVKNVNDDPSLTDKARSVAIEDIMRWGRDRDLADEQNQKAVKARSDKAQDHVFNLLNQGDFIGASRQADADAAAGHIDQRELSTLRETIQKRAGTDETTSYGPMYTDIFSRMLLPENDPNGIRTRREILMAENAGQITPKGSDRLIKHLADIDKGEGGRAEMEKAALDMAKRHLSFEVDYGNVKIPDPKGADYINQFTQRFYTSLRDWTEKNQPLEKFPLFDNDEILKAVNQIRPPSQREREFIDAQHQQLGDTVGGTPPAQIPAPQGIDGDAWVKVVSAPPMLQTGQRMKTDDWAKAVSRLSADPSPKALADFEAWFPGQSGQGVLDILGTKAQAAPEATQPEFAPSNLTPAPPIANVRARNLEEQHAPSPKRGPEIRYETPVPDEGAAARQRQYMATHEPAPPAKPENVRTRRLREQHENEGR